MKSILDKVEKIGRLKKSEKDFTPVEEKDDLGLLVIIGFQNNEHEYFNLEREAAIEAVNNILTRMKDKKWGAVILRKKEYNQTLIKSTEELKDFIGIITIDETVRTIRILDPNDLPSKED